MEESTNKLQRFFEELMVILIPILIIFVVIGALVAFIDWATPKNPLDEFLGGGGIFKFFMNLPSDGLKILLIGAIVTGVFGLITVVAITAKDGRRFWYKILFRKEPPT